MATSNPIAKKDNRKKYQRKDGLIRVTLNLPKKNGKQQQKHFYGSTKAEATAKKQEYIKQMNMGTFIEQSLTLGDWAATWLQVYKNDIKYNTVVYYKSALNAHILPQIGDMLLTDVKPIHIQKIYNTLKGSSKSKINSVRITLNQLFETAINNNLLNLNPNRGVSIPKGTKHTRECISDDLKQIITSRWSEHRCGIWAMIMLYSGLRRGEVVALKWADVDFENHLLSVSHAVYFQNNQPVISNPKTYTGIRVIPLAKPLYDALLLCDRSNEFICVSSQNKLLSETAFVRGWNSFKLFLRNSINENNKNCDTIDVMPHMLRHTFCTMLYDAGIDVLVAREYMGHSDISTTLKIYTHLSNENKSKAEEKFENYFNSIK